MDDNPPAITVTTTSSPNASASPCNGRSAQTGQMATGRSVLLRPKLAVGKKNQRPHSAHEYFASNGIKNSASGNSSPTHPRTHTPSRVNSFSPQPRPRSRTLPYHHHHTRLPAPPPPQLSKCLSLPIGDIREEHKRSQQRGMDSTERGYSERRLECFIAQHSKRFPLRVKVCKGFCGNSSEVSISQGEVFDFHFLKHNKVVSMRVLHGVEYSVPLSSVIQFGVVYDPYGNEKMALNGFQFRTVNEIMGLKNLPILVCATRAFQGSHHDACVDKGEVMVVRGIKNSIRGRMLKVYSLKQGKKYLSEKCEAYFSTRPSDVSMQLHEMFHNSIPFPQKAMVYPTVEVSRVLPPHMLNSPVLLKQCKVQTSVVATCPIVSSNQEGSGVIDIPVNLDTEIEACNLPPSECAKLQQITRSIYKSFDPAHLCSYFDTPTSESYEVQCALFSSVQTGLKRFGVQLVKPDILFEDQAYSLECLHHDGIDSPLSLEDQWSQLELSSSQCSSPASSDFPTNQSDIILPEAMDSRHAQLEERVTQLSKQVVDLTAKVDRLATIVERSTQFTQELGSIGVTDSLMTWCSKIQGEVTQLQADMKNCRT